MKTRIKNISSIYTWNSDANKLQTFHNHEILILNNEIIEISSNKIVDYDIEIDALDSIITPGFIDSHTHPVFVNNRADEFIMRSKNLSYSEINKQGGGINSSIEHLRRASYQDLYDSSYNNIKNFITFGTTTIEAKSGYGLSLDDEIKSLKVLKEINNDLDIDIIPTFLGAHSIPPEFINDREAYIDLICNEMIPAIAKDNLAVFCDVFCEEGYFSIKESEKILNVAKSFGLLPKIHADEFSYFGASKLAKDIGAVSADHLMAINNEGIESLSNSNVISTLLPGTTFFLKKRKYADGRLLIDSGCEVALATDFNPGTCTIRSLSTIMLLALNYCGMSIDESFKAVTYNAARAIGKDNIGRISPGCKADLIFWNLKSINEIPYWFDSSITKISNVMKDGKIVNISI